MSKRQVVLFLTFLCLSLLLVLASCRTGADQADTSVNETQLRAALLSVEDLPPGWTRDDADEDGGEDGEDAGESTTFFLGQELPDRSRFTVSAGFSGGDLGPFVTHAVSAFPEGQAAVAFAEQSEVIRTAAPYTITLSGGTTMAMEMWPLTFASVGSDSIAVRSVSEDAPLFGTVYTDSVYVLAADAGAIIRLTAISLSGEAMNRAQMRELAQRSVEKLSRVLEER
ncbi:MAG TPA: hypothetical protein VK879_20090 [Candidatus Sulfomarinibacteraceae bacterium]|nr:hypothetical protein [Candidatus Sulfomarinibacteraceae bacterium]